MSDLESLINGSDFGFDMGARDMQMEIDSAVSIIFNDYVHTRKYALYGRDLAIKKHSIMYYVNTRI